MQGYPQIIRVKVTHILDTFSFGSVKVVSQIDFCVSCALMIKHEGQVYMSHGR